MPDSVDLPLAGIRVIEFCHVAAGPFCGMLLADYGAEVLKVERPGAGDDTRHWGPPWWGEGDTRHVCVCAYVRHVCVCVRVRHACLCVSFSEAIRAGKR